MCSWSAQRRRNDHQNPEPVSQDISVVLGHRHCDGNRPRCDVDHSSAEKCTSQSQTILADTAWVSGTATVDALEQHGASAASAYMEQFSQKTHLKSCLFDTSGKVIAGSDCASFDDIVSPASISGEPAFSSEARRRPSRCEGAGNSGRQYIYAVESAEHHGPPPGIGLLGIALRWSVALLVSGFICYLLTRYLTAPILRLREASQHLAQGDLSTRAAAGMERRRDELGSLVRDFNAMANASRSSSPGSASSSTTSRTNCARLWRD